MTNGNGNRGPWWVLVVERTGSLGLVLVMLIGFFFYMRDEAADTRGTWIDIREMMKVEEASAAEVRSQLHRTLDHMLNVSKANGDAFRTTMDRILDELSDLTTRVSRLEEKVK
jgi:hypothetical protein